MVELQEPAKAKAARLVDTLSAWAQDPNRIVHQTLRSVWQSANVKTVLSLADEAFAVYSAEAVNVFHGLHQSALEESVRKHKEAKPSSGHGSSPEDARKPQRRVPATVKGRAAKQEFSNGMLQSTLK
jgi:hypothetical protein